MINIRDSGFYDPLRDARTAAWLERAYVVESQLDGKRASRPVGRPTGATDSRNARLENAIAAMRHALVAIAEVTEGHPLYMGEGRSEEDIEKEGGDAATFTELAYLARVALGVQA